MTQPHPLSLLRGLSSQAHLVLSIRFLGTCVSESVGQVVPSADSGPTQPYWSGSEDARISRKFSDLSPLKDDSAWIWGASVEPGLGPTVHCSLSKHQPKARLGMHKKERSGVHHAAESHCRKSLYPTPCPVIQFRTLWELENASTLNTTPLLSSLLGSLIKAQFIHVGSYFLSVKDRQILTKTGVCRNQQQRSCKCCSFPSSPTKIQTRESSKISVDPPHSPGSVPRWCPYPCCWFIEFSLLASNTQIFSCGAVFLRHFP